MGLDPKNIKPGEEQSEKLVAGVYAYDYRDLDGSVFWCCDKTLEGCRKKRDEWLGKKSKGGTP